jgi:hypothetical protein
MAWYSGDSYQAFAAAFVANLNTTVTCPADPSHLRTDNTEGIGVIAEGK